MVLDVVAEDGMRAALQAYIDRFNVGDAEGLAALFASDAQIEDPVGGSTIVRGRAEIDAFYRRVVSVVEHLILAQEEVYRSPSRVAGRGRVASDSGSARQNGTPA